MFCSLVSIFQLTFLLVWMHSTGSDPHPGLSLGPQPPPSTGPVCPLLNRSCTSAGGCPCSCPLLSDRGLSSCQPLPSVGLMLSGGMAAGTPSPGHEPRLHSLCPTSIALPLSGPQPHPHSWPILPFASLRAC